MTTKQVADTGEDKAKRPGRLRRLAPMLLTVAILLLLTLGVVLLRKIQAPSSVEITGSIVGSQDNTPIPAANVVAGGNWRRPPVRTFSDNNGRFTLRVGKADDVPLFVRAIEFEELTRIQDLDRANRSAGIYVGKLELVRRQADTRNPDYAVAKRQDGRSGYGSDYGPTTTICSDPPRPGFVIRSAKFHLEGDRECNSWSTCKEESRSETGICYSFALQGHSECLSQHGPFGIAIPRPCQDAVRTSTGVLYVTYTFAGHPLPVYVNYSVSAGSKNVAEDVCRKLSASDFICQRVVDVGGKFSSRIVFFRAEDQSRAEEVAKVVDAAHSPAASGPTRIDKESAPPGISETTPLGLEVWLGTESK